MKPSHLSQIFQGHLIGMIFFSVLVIVFLIYQPALNGPFVFDDGPNVTKNEPLRISSLGIKEILFAMNSVQSGPLGRPLAYASFALNYYFFGPESYSFKLVNLIIHLLNGICIYVLSKLLLRAYSFCQNLKLKKNHIQWIAFGTATLWLSHPLALSPVLYVVQRMTSLAALFSFLTFIFYFWARIKQLSGNNGFPLIIVAFGIFAPLAVFCKDNAILIPFFLIITDWVLLRLKTRNNLDRILVYGLLASTILPLLAVILMHEHVIGSLVAGYKIRPFTLFEHALTESRVLWFYLRLIFFPAPEQLGLYHDDIQLSTGLFRPITTILSLSGLASIFIGSIIFRKQAPFLSFGILFFLVGHSIESSIFSLEIAHEHRNYLPMYGLALAFSYYALHPRLPYQLGRISTIGFIFFIALLQIVTMIRVSDWKDNGSLSLSLVQHHPNSARSNYEAGKLFTTMIENNIDTRNQKQYYKLARKYFESSYLADKFNLNGLFGILYLDSISSKKADAELVAELKWRLSNNPVLPSTSSSFSSLFDCYKANVCQIKNNTFIDLYQSALTNQLTERKIRANLLNQLAMLYLDKGDTIQAVALFHQSITLNPIQAQLRFNLIYTLIKSGQLADAEKELITIRQTNLRLKEVQKLTNLEAMFTTASNSLSH